ncbi:type IV pilin protein [Thalassotalea mangrovi]|uniref:Prepilin-type N-terminal cleavage/methylation domain-containing protein n=1 Tax=Thalassotalea mangrovi TaxID=2572245 RepID=A0A4U1B3A7_9GAMM|nr:type IV pilin protein [Thalassotalea mangrovi]TKB44256.1 prepilin-type N-terminal cleavage/methylation domain-containing protein [Thalassotalea mangrovi]
MKNNTSKTQGFTLIELLVVVAIVGILSMIAYPGYQDSVRKARRSDAHSGMMSMMLAQQKLRGSCPFYAQAIGGANSCGASGAATTVKSSSSSQEGYYAFALSNASGNSYTITATAQGAQTSDTGCTSITLTVNAANPKGLKAPAQCW